MHRSGNVIRLILATTAAGLLLSGCLCRGRTSPPLPIDALEPNDTPGQATELSGTLDATMNEGDEPDVFRIEVAEGETVTIEIEHSDGGLLDLDVEVSGPEAVIDFLPRRPGAKIHDAPITFDITPVADGGTFFITLTGVYTGPPDALCIRGALSYLITPDP